MTRPLCSDCRFFVAANVYGGDESYQASTLRNLSTCAASLPDLILGAETIKLAENTLAFNQRFVGACGLEGALFEKREV